MSTELSKVLQGKKRSEDSDKKEKIKKGIKAKRKKRGKERKKRLGKFTKIITIIMSCIFFFVGRGSPVFFCSVSSNVFYSKTSTLRTCYLNVLKCLIKIVTNTK